MTRGQLRYLIKALPGERYQLGSAISKYHVELHRERVARICDLLQQVNDAIAEIECDCPEL